MKHRAFYEALASFAQIDEDPVQGKIYLNLSVDNYKKILPFLLRNANHQYFDDFLNFNHNLGPGFKERRVKNYIYNELEYSFDYHAVAMENLETVVIHLKPASPDLNNSINVESAEFLIFYLIMENIEAGIINPLFNERVVFYLSRCASQPFKKQFEGQIWEYMNNAAPGFYATIYFMSLAVILNPGDNRVLKTILSALLNDTQYLSYHYSIIINVLFYISSCKLQVYPEFYIDQRQELDRLSTWDQSVLPAKMNKPQKGIRNIAIHVDQLLAITHSPTKLMLDYARFLKKAIPGSRINIFVEDNLFSNVNETIVPLIFSSAESKTCQLEHENYLQNPDIKIFYANTEKTSLYRTHQVIAAINDLNPDVVLTNSCISLAMASVYEHFPVVYFSMGGEYFSCRADVYLVAWADEVLHNNKVYKLLDSSLVESINVGIDFPVPKQNKSRSDYGLAKSQFVMITVGNRLHADMSWEFITEIGKFLIDHHDAVWLLVGVQTWPELAVKYADLMNSKRIVMLTYEYDLVALYDLCDVFINPVRYGGGHSIAWAMSRRLPVLQLKISSAGLNIVGHENSIGSALEAYGTELERLYRDVHYRRDFGERMYKRIQEFNMDSSVSSLIEFMFTAGERYQKRIGQ